jgi:hypothetical protein
VLALALPAVLPAQNGPDPRENSFQFIVDGTQVNGIIGYQVAFNHDPMTKSDSRQLNTLYSPDNRRLSITVTQKGLTPRTGSPATNSGDPISSPWSSSRRTTSNIPCAELTNAARHDPSVGAGV